MSESIRNIIQNLADELKMFNRNDILVNFQDKSSVTLNEISSEIELPIEGELQQSIKKANAHFRESGTSIFCLSKGILEWEWKGMPCQTPIILYPCDFKENRIKKNYHLKWDSEEGFLNPFLKFHFEKEYDYTWPEIDLHLPNWAEIEAVLVDRGFQLTIGDKNHFGNFHHHRFSILRELESLANSGEIGSNVVALLEKTSLEGSRKLALKPNTLFPADNDQLKVFSAIQDKNLVVQGPPGTGKSQVLSNILGQTLSSDYSALVVSEKRVALEVLEEKMEEKDLHRFIFVQKENHNSQYVLKQLKETWQFLESYKPKIKSNVPLSKFKLDALQFKLNILSDEKRVGGISYLQFLKLSEHIDLQPVAYYSKVPALAEYLENVSDIKSFYEKRLNGICRSLPKSIIDGDEIFGLDEKIKRIEKQWKDLQKVIAFDTKSELKEVTKKAVFAQILKNESQKDYFDILIPKGSARKKFTRLSKKYFVLKKELSNFDLQDSDWKKRPSVHETKELQQALATGFVGKWKAKKRLGQLLQTSFISPEKALERNLEYHQLQAQFRIIEKDLTEIGIVSETEIHWVKDLVSKVSEELWQTWQENDARENNKLAFINSELDVFQQNLKTYLKLSDQDSISDTFSTFHSLHPTLLENRKTLKDFSSNLYFHFGQCASFEEFEKTVLKSNWVSFVEQFPAFGSFELNKIWEDLDEIILQEEKESEIFIHEIISKKKAEFDTLNDLLQIPARKLSTEEKERKSRLRKGRSLLIKEFGKTRSHPTIRELLESDAREWIYQLLPIWMVNPSFVGDFFPLESSLFDLVLFDEATQIPLSHALGAVHRGERALVLGDEQQMSPTYYFKAGDSEPIDLLHQASFNWPKIMLKHHYRSQHPELIAFSNRHFYNNELIAYPSAKRNETPIEIHLIPEAKYIDQQNNLEAKKVADKFSQVLANSDGSVGLVAFSEKQLKCIYDHLPPATQQLLDEKMDENKAFFRALENVQGDECDSLIISLGYGKNDEGKLNFNFGPLNRKTGPRRLNVLLSRAKQKIDFFTSIEGKDLSLSDNDGLNLLRLFLNGEGSGPTNSEVQFPQGLEIESLHHDDNGGIIQFKNLFEAMKDANELLTLYRVLSSRGWKISI